MNECLQQKSPTESLLFDVILMISDSQQEQQRSRIISSTRHHGKGELPVRFCPVMESDSVNVMSPLFHRSSNK